MIGGFQPLAFQPAYQQAGVVSTRSVGYPSPFHRQGIMAEVNGEMRYFATLEDLREFLASFTKKQKKKLRKRTVTKVEIPRIEIAAQTPQPAIELIQRANASMEAYYWSQYEVLVKAKQEQDEDDDEALIALFG